MDLMTKAEKRKKHAAYQLRWFKKNRNKCLKWMRRYNKTHRKERSAYWRALLYRMTLEEFENRLKKQKHRCASCKEKLVKLNVDHDHKCCNRKNKRTCGKCTRGILCERCNLGLGNFSDRIDLLLKAVHYLRKWERKEAL